jgi:hypothetical protein
MSSTIRGAMVAPTQGGLMNKDDSVDAKHISVDREGGYQTLDDQRRAPAEAQAIWRAVNWRA